jgi:hypothetical protein
MASKAHAFDLPRGRGEADPVLVARRSLPWSAQPVALDTDRGLARRRSYARLSRSTSRSAGLRAVLVVDHIGATRHILGHELSS